MNKKIFFALLVVLFLSAGLARAANFELKLSTVNDETSPIESAVFNLSIQNKLSREDSYTLDFATIDTTAWLITTVPPSQDASGITVPSQSSKTITISIKRKPPFVNYTSTYSIPLKITSTATGEQQNLNIAVSVTALLSGKEYASVLLLKTTIAEAIDPRQDNKIIVQIINLMPIKREGMKIVVNDKLGLIDEKRTNVTIPAAGKTTLEIPFKLNPAQKPAEDTITTFVMNSKGEVVKDNTESPTAFKIVEYSVLNESERTDKYFLKKVTIITVKNDGNTEKTYLAKRKISFFRNLFLRTEPRAKKMRTSEGKYLAWSVTVPAQSEKEIYLTENYRGIVLLLLLIAGIIAAYVFIKPPISVRKRAGITKIREGGISQLKVVINVKNISNKSVQDLKVVDSIPDIADVEENFEAGTIKPDNITKNITKGTLVKWNLGRIEAKEERVISYRIRSKLTIIGYFRLHPAVVKYTYKNKEAIVKSNSVSLEIDKEEFGIQ